MILLGLAVSLGADRVFCPHCNAAPHVSLILQSLLLVARSCVDPGDR